MARRTDGGWRHSMPNSAAVRVRTIQKRLTPRESADDTCSVTISCYQLSAQPRSGMPPASCGIACRCRWPVSLSHHPNLCAVA
jgi:hypothetical protein